MAVRELFRSPEFTMPPDSRFCTSTFGGFIPVPHGPEVRGVKGQIFVLVSAPDSFTDQNWETVKGCAVIAGGLGAAAAIAVMTSTEGLGWPAALAAFGAAFANSFAACVAIKFAADVASQIGSDVKEEKKTGAWTNH